MVILNRCLDFMDNTLIIQDVCLILKKYQSYYLQYGPNLIPDPSKGTMDFVLFLNIQSFLNNFSLIIQV